MGWLIHDPPFPSDDVAAGNRRTTALCPKGRTHMRTMPAGGREITTLTSEVLKELSDIESGPCLSLYQPTHRRHPENQEDPIRFRNLVKELEASLHQKYPAAESKELLEPFHALAQDADFWNHALEGLAVLGAPGVFRALRFSQPVDKLVVVADSFHTKPLRRFLQTADRYHVLGLTLHGIRLFEGNRRSLDEVDMATAVPGTIGESRGDGSAEGNGGGAGIPLRHALGGKGTEADNEADRYFRAVDRAVLEHYSRPTGLPLILAALPEHHHRFHEVSQNPFLLAAGIRLNPESLSSDKLREHAWEVVEPQYQARLAALHGEFEQAKARGTGSDVLAEVAQAAAAGRVATLMVEAGREIAGRLDAETGRIEAADLGAPDVDDMLDDLGELVTKMGGTVLVVPAERVSLPTGLAATYRY